MEKFHGSLILDLAQILLELDSLIWKIHLAQNKCQ